MRAILATGVIVVTSMLLPSVTATAQDEGWREQARAGREAQERGDYAGAERLLRLALSEVERLDKEGPGTADVLVDLANLLVELPRFAEAEALAKRALKINESAFGPNGIPVRWNLESLGTVYQKQGRYTESEPLYRRALAIVEASPDADTEDLAGALQNLG
jgi:tetratricopeptide (TPR) repeat protein